MLQHPEGFVCDLQGCFDILVGKSIVQKMVVMVGDKNAPSYHLCDPALVQHQCVIVGQPQVK